MKYFEGLRFLGWDNLPKYMEENDREHMRYYALQFNYSGPLRYAFCRSRESDSAFRVVDAPCAWLISPGNRYVYGTLPGAHRWHRWVSFEGPRVETFLKGGLISAGLAIEPILISRPEQLAFEFDRLFELLADYRRDAAVHCLEGILYMIHSQPEQTPELMLSSRIQALVRRMAMNPGADWNFEEQASRMSVSRSHFGRVFKECMQSSPGQFLQKARLEFAAELLRRTSYTLTEISFRSGFSNANYFTRLFSRSYRMSPSRYRKVSVRIEMTDGIDV